MPAYLDCTPFPATRIFWTARKIGRGPLAGAYVGVVTTVESNNWTPASWTRGRHVSAVHRTTRADAMADATTAAREAARTGYVPTF